MVDATPPLENTPLSPLTVLPSPIAQFAQWLSEACASPTPGLNPHDVCLSTCTPDAIPSARIVLLKHFDERGFAFHTHDASRKARELTANPRAALTFFWAPLSRSVRVIGRAEHVSSEESDQFFLGRPRAGLVAAWASEQSAVVSEGEVRERVNEIEKAYEGKDVPRPENWGGWRVVPEEVEFSQGSMKDRLHDRVRYKLSPEGAWIIKRLAP